jgi:hypothetical protein
LALSHTILIRQVALSDLSQLLPDIPSVQQQDEYDLADCESDIVDAASQDGEENLPIAGKPQVIPLLHSSTPELVDCYSMYAAQNSVKQRILIKRHPYDLAFALTDFKLQGRTLPKLVLSVCKRSDMPWMTLQSFYVLISRVPSMSGLRLLQYDRLGLKSVRTQMPDLYLYAWEHGYNDIGLWDPELAVVALRNIRSTRQMDKNAFAARTRAQPFSDTQRSPSKKRPASEHSPHKTKCARCRATDHGTQGCHWDITVPRRPLFIDAAARSAPPIREVQ